MLSQSPSRSPTREQKPVMKSLNSTLVSHLLSTSPPKSCEASSVLCCRLVNLRLSPLLSTSKSYPSGKSLVTLTSLCGNQTHTSRYADDRNVVEQAWTLPEGVFTLYIGSSSRDIKLMTALVNEGGILSPSALNTVASTVTGVAAGTVGGL